MTELFRLATEDTQHCAEGVEVVMEDHEQQYDPENQLC